MRMEKRLTSLLPLMLCLGACGPPAQPGASMVQAAAAAPAAPLPAPATDAVLAVAVARDAAARSAREQTLRVQQHLREQQREQQQVREAASHGNERCIAGQRMRRVANGWVDAGAC